MNYNKNSKVCFILELYLINHLVKKKIMKYLMTAILSLFLLQTQAQETYNGVTLPATLQLGEESLALNGGGIRSKFTFKLYTGGLYLAEKSSDAKAIVDGDKPMAIRLAITSGKINSNNMSEAIEEGFGKSTGGKTASIQSEINTLIKTFSAEAISKGDVFDLVYVPGVGVQSYKNGTLKTTIKGLNFKQALFGIWLSDNPVAGGLKNGMLGK